MSLEIALQVNGAAVSAAVEARRTLLELLREDLGLTGTHGGCEQGACGACSVLLDGAVVRSCLVLAASADGHEVTTIEAVGTPDRLHPLQLELMRHHGLQCGYCTPGVVMTALELLARVGAPDEAQVREALSGNLCRCTGYSGLVAAVVAAGRGQPGAGHPGAGQPGAGTAGGPP